MSWNAPDTDLRSVHPDWLEPISARFGDGGLWRDMLGDAALRPRLLEHIQYAAFGQAAAPPSVLLGLDDIERILGADGRDIVRVAGWFWYAPVLLPRLISRGMIPGLTPPNLSMIRAMRDWSIRDDAGNLVVPGDDAVIERAGAACRLAWLRSLDQNGVTQRVLLQLPASTVSQQEIAEAPVAGPAFQAALDCTTGTKQ